jgi:hypothetical protein
MSEVTVRLKKGNLNSKAYYKALKRFGEMFPEKTEHWIDTCKLRLFDVVFLGLDKGRRHFGRKKFRVYRNSDIDKAESKFSFYTVYLYGIGRNSWCSCRYAKYGNRRMVQVCTHVGACILFNLYIQELTNISSTTDTLNKYFARK